MRILSLSLKKLVTRLPYAKSIEEETLKRMESEGQFLVTINRDEGYAREELVAELGGAFLCADLELTPEPGEDHAAYIQSWLKVLKNDKRAIFAAAAHAQRAADFLRSQQPQLDETMEVAA